jgi:transcriptional regulator with XRE-family HTH domain
MTTPDEREAFARRLCTAMAHRHIDARHLAERTGIHASLIERWRTGAGMPTLPAIEQLARMLGTTASRLKGEAPDPH